MQNNFSIQVKGGKVFLANLEKNPTYYETGYFILILFCRIN